MKIEIKSMLEYIVDESFDIKKITSMNDRYVELAIIKMMAHCKNLLSKFSDTVTNTLSKPLSKIFMKKELTELVIGLSKVIHEKEQYSLISKKCLEDLQSWVDTIKKSINFNASKVIMDMPELIFKTSYDNLLENKSIGLYPSQKEIFNFITTTDKYLALVHTMLGSGKTSMVLPICGWLSNNKQTIKTKLMYCCPNEAVLLEVAHMVYGMGVSFAIVIQNKKEKRLEYKWSSFADKKNPRDSAILYLCDIFITRILLEERMECIKCKDLFLKQIKKIRKIIH